MINEDLLDGYALAADFGGGTFDVAVIRFAPDGGDVVALAGAEIGGEQFDRLLFQAKVAPALHLNESYKVRPDVSRTLPHQFRKRLASLSGLKTLLSDPIDRLDSQPSSAAAKGGERLAAVENILYGGYAYQFYRAIEQAKIGTIQHLQSVHRLPPPRHRHLGSGATRGVRGPDRRADASRPGRDLPRHPTMPESVPKTSASCCGREALPVFRHSCRYWRISSIPQSSRNGPSTRPWWTDSRDSHWGSGYEQRWPKTPDPYQR